MDPSRVLLRTSDVPVGYAVAEASAGLGSDGLCGQPNFSTIVQPAAHAQVLYRRGLLESSFYQVVDRYRSKGDAERFMRALRSQVDQCHAPDYRASSVSGPLLGEETMVVRITGTSIGVAVMVVFRQDTIVENVGQAGLVIADAQAVSVARKAYDRLAR